MCTNKTTLTMNRKRHPKPKARRSRFTKAKKPKFLSLLRLQFPAEDGNQIKPNAAEMAEAAEQEDAVSDQLDLFKLRQENLAEERENNDHENVDFYFAAADGGATSLTGLLGASSAAAAAESNSSHTDNNSCRVDYLPPSSASLTQAYSDERAALVRNALRSSRDRDSSEEKWVCYSEVVKEEEVSSSAVDPPPRLDGIQWMSLKLDYDEIMNAWSNKGPLYVDAADNNNNNYQIVPDMNHPHFLSHDPFSNMGLNMGCNGGSWTVPEMVGDIENGETRTKNGDELKMGQREASVLRYKEKRQNRLFSKKIRYQVRKLNAEKRPRLKGRFVKRS